ncbi:hypothetical protein ScPMuIL_014014 [Solemya velum]
MAYWFHRNPLKATIALTFELRGVSTSDQTRKIFSDLRQTRNRLLELLTDPTHDRSIIDKAMSDYMSLLQGLIMPMADGEAENKLRRTIPFKWTNTLLGNTPVEKFDSIFECASMAVNVALWYTKHAAKIAAKDEPDMEEAKEVHKCLRIAAGIFSYIKTELIGKLEDNTEKGTDTDSRVLEAYFNQCTAEAQEVTFAQAIERKLSSSLTSALAFETAQMFKRADDSLTSLDVKDVGKWRKYFQLKSDFYMSCAYSYHGETLLAQDKCGEAIRGLQEGAKLYDKSATLCKEYATTKGPGTSAKPQDHLFFRKFGPIMKRTLEKCDRENGLIYHQKLPFDPPQLELKATYGLVSPEDFTTPSLSPLWTSDCYQQMNEKMAPKPEGKKDDKKPSDLPPVKEKEVPMSDKDPKTFSGCSVS